LSVKERILTIRLMEKALKMPDEAEHLGIRVRMDSDNKACASGSRKE